MVTDEEKTVRIFLLRTTETTALMIISLEWVTSPITRKEKIPTDGINGYYQEVVWIDGELKIVVEEFVERRNLKIETLINTLNKLDIPVIGHHNDLLESKILAGFYPILINHELSDEHKENEKVEVRDVVNLLYTSKRIINKSQEKIDTPLGNDLLAMVVRCYKNELIRTSHHCYTSPCSMPNYEYHMGRRYLQQIKNILSERSQYNPLGIPR